METIGYLLASITFIYLWDIKVRHDLFTVKKGVMIYYKSKFAEWMMETKPFNCATCITFWGGIILFICLGNIYLLSLPLFYKLIVKYL